MSSLFLKSILLLVQFPWLFSAFNGYDVQPWLMIVVPVVGYIVFATRYRFSWSTILFFCLLVFVYTLFNYRLSFEVVRVIASSLYVLSGLYLVRVAYVAGVDYVPVLVVGNVVYLSASLCQVVFGVDVFGFLVEVRTNNVRGVTSLAPEPTFFALAISLYSIVYFRSRRFLLLSYVNLLFILLVAKSATGVMVFLVILFGYAVDRISLRNCLLMLMVVFCVAYSLSFVMGNDFGRVSHVLSKVFSDPVALLSSDRSVLIRFVHSLSPLFMHFYNFGLPVPELGVAELRMNIFKSFDGGSMYFYSDSDKTSSWVGSYLLSFGVLFYYIVFRYILSSIRNTRKFGLMVSYLIILNASFPIGMPMVGVVFGVMTNCRDASPRLCKISKEKRRAFGENEKA